MTTNQDIQVKVSAALVAAERSMAWASEKTGIPLTTLRRKMLGGSEFTVPELARVANALGVAPASLLPDAFIDEEIKAVA